MKLTRYCLPVLKVGLAQQKKMQTFRMQSKFFVNNCQSQGLVEVSMTDWHDELKGTRTNYGEHDESQVARPFRACELEPALPPLGLPPWPTEELNSFMHKPWLALLPDSEWSENVPEASVNCENDFEGETVIRLLHSRGIIVNVEESEISMFHGRKVLSRLCAVLKRQRVAKKASIQFQD